MSVLAETAGRQHLGNRVQLFDLSIAEASLEMRTWSTSVKPHVDVFGASSMAASNGMLATCNALPVTSKIRFDTPPSFDN